MSSDKPKTAGLWEELREAYDSYLTHSFMPKPPDRPLIDHWQAKGERAARVVFGMPVLPVILLRLRNRLVRLRVPILPYLCELLSGALWSVLIGRYVQIGPGFLIPHGHIVIDGEVKIGRNCTVNPWVTIGLSRRRHLGGLDLHGPTIGDRVFIGTGAKLLGPITIGDGARIGANAVVIEDVPANATVVGVPARVVQTAPPAWEAAMETAPHIEAGATGDAAKDGDGKGDTETQ